MTSFRRIAVACAIIALLLLSGSPLAQTIQRIPIPDGVFFNEPAADAFGLEAAWINPAELGRYRAGAFMVMADYFDGSFAKSWGWAATKNHFVSAYRKLDRPEGEYKEWIWAGGFELTSGVQLGLAYRYFSDGPDFYNNRHFWNLGIAGGYGPKWRYGVVFSNLNQGRVNGERTETEMRYSLAFKPYGPNFTIAADMALSTGMSVSDADLTYHASYTPIRGLYLYGGLDSDQNFMLGFRTNLIEYFVGARSRFSEGGDGRGTTAYVGVTDHRQPSITRQPQRRLSLAISGRPSENPVRPVFGRQPEAYATVLTTIYRAAKDPSISSMVLDLKRLRLGLAQAQELRSAIGFFREHGKRVTCYMQGANNISYFVAAGCDEILIPPVSRVNLVGLRAELSFYAGTLDKIGVEMELLRIGKYKSATEAYMRESSSEEYRVEINHLLDETYDQFVSAIAEGRKISSDSVMALIDQGPFTSEAALAAGLVDGLVYRDRLVGDYLKGLPQISFKRYLSDTLMNDSWQKRPKIAVVVAEGDVVDQLSGLPFGSDDKVTPGAMSRAFAAAVSDPEVKGIVLRVNSPGGEALAGEAIHRAAERAAEKKPLVVSMGNVSASAAFYFSTPAERLFASPGTVTGSIGIFGGKADLSGLYEKVALHKELYTRGRYAGMMTFSRAFTEEERAKYFSQLRAMYDHFVDLVADNRNLPVDSIEALSQGRVWSGRDARRVGLIDELGGLKEALDYAASELGLDDYEIIIHPERRPLFLFPGGSLFRSVASLFVGHDGGPEVLLSPLADGEGPIMMARLPFDVTIE